MSDLRQGVSQSTHEALDLWEEKAEHWSDAHDFEEQLALGRAAALRACRRHRLSAKYQAAIEAAARLLDAADELKRMLRVGDE